MLNIELPWIDGLRLTRRWYPFVLTEDVDYEELHHCIFESGLPVYNFDRELQEGIVDKEEITFKDDGEPDFVYDKRNILYFFDTYVRHPEKFDPLDTFHSHALRRVRTKDRTHLHAYIWDILKCMFFKMEDVKQFEEKHGFNEKDLPDNIDEKSEFALYDSIVNGELRPFLEIYSSKNHIEKLMKKLWRVSIIKTENGFKDTSKQDESLLEIFVKPGDTVKIEIDETDLKKPGELTNITDSELEELFDIDIPPPPDLKAEYFLDLIEIEFKKIKLRANKALQTSSSEEELSLFVNKNIQTLKKIAGQAHTLSKRIKPKINKDKWKAPWDDPDSYIIDMLKIYIVRSILFYQELFQPYLKVPIQDEFELRTYLYGQRHPTVVMRELDEGKRNELYKNLGVEMNRLKNNGNDKNLDQQIYSLKNLILNENWLKTVAKDAVSNGFIGISHLVFIMASDENYTKNLILTQLIENMFSELQERKDYYFGFKELSISDYKSRIDVWHELIHHWVKGNNEYFRDKYKNYLPLYYLNPTTKDLDRFDHKKMHDQLIQERQKEKSDELSIEERIEVSKIINYIARFVKLSELKKYLVDVIGIPLPSLLFPKDIETKHKKLRPSQKAKNECRKIAKKIWGENPQITIADMINHDDLLSYTTKKDGNFYTEKTVRNWIKNLCPDRSRGRRKST